MTTVPTDHILFRQRIDVDPSDIDALGHVSNVSYLRWVQDIALAHSSEVGWAFQRYVDLGMFFVVRRHEIDYLRPALLGDRIELCTWVESWKAATSLRRTTIGRAGDGVELARAATTWALVSAEDGRPCRIPRELRNSFPVASSATRDGLPVGS